MRYSFGYRAKITRVETYSRGIEIATDESTIISVEPAPTIPVEPGMDILVMLERNFVMHVEVNGVTILHRTEQPHFTRSNKEDADAAH